MTKTSKTLTAKFENRVRFNWGYHDAAHAVKGGWATQEKNFGFGPALKVVSAPFDVLTQHSDKEYARGWQQGFDDALNGTYRGDSQAAWERCLSNGTVKA